MVLSNGNHWEALSKGLASLVMLQQDRAVHMPEPTAGSKCGAGRPPGSLQKLARHANRAESVRGAAHRSAMVRGREDPTPAHRMLWAESAVVCGLLESSSLLPVSLVHEDGSCLHHSPARPEHLQGCLAVST